MDSVLKVDPRELEAVVESKWLIVAAVILFYLHVFFAVFFLSTLPF